jgi:hypothetical protein
MRLYVPTATSIKMAAFWDVAPCTLVHTNRRFVVLTMGILNSSKMSANCYYNTRRNIPEGSHLQMEIKSDIM